MTSLSVKQRSFEKSFIESWRHMTVFWVMWQLADAWALACRICDWTNPSHVSKSHDVKWPGAMLLTSHPEGVGCLVKLVSNDMIIWFTFSKFAFLSLILLQMKQWILSKNRIKYKVYYISIMQIYLKQSEGFPVAKPKHYTHFQPRGWVLLDITVF